jgi:hypothetical protein
MSRDKGGEYILVTSGSRRDKDGNYLPIEFHKVYTKDFRQGTEPQSEQHEAEQTGKTMPQIAIPSVLDN